MTYAITITEPGTEPVTVSLEWTTDAPLECGVYYAEMKSDAWPGPDTVGIFPVIVCPVGFVLVPDYDERFVMDDFTRWLGPIPMPPNRA